MMKSLQRGFRTGFSRGFAIALFKKSFADNMSKAEKEKEDNLMKLRARENSMKFIYQKKLTYTESRLTQKFGNTFMGLKLEELIEEG